LRLFFVLGHAVGADPNAARFPADFMFQLTAEEWEVMWSQIATTNTGRGGWRYFPYAFGTMLI
jgi:hypothetical protein